MNKILLNPTTQKQLDTFLTSPSHALLLEGPKGSGKGYLARWTAEKLLNKESETLENYPYLLSIQTPADKQSISIDEIRKVNKFLQLKVPGGQNRAVIIEDAQLMTIEAQNVVLKALEEPPENTIFILTATADRSLLPTVSSRATTITVRPVSLQLAKKLLGYNKLLESHWQLSGGAAGLLTALASDEATELKQAVENAKKILSQPRYERLLELDTLGRDKRQFELTLEGLTKVIQALYKGAARRGTSPNSLLEAMKAISDAQDSLRQNSSARLIALNLALNLPI